MQRLKRPDLRWDDVRLFLSLCRARTIGRAGKALGVDASTVSRRLAALERALGMSLFERGRDGMTPTSAAERLVATAEELESVIGRFASAVESFERAPSGLVRVACPPDLAEVVLVPIVADLVERHPGLRVAIDPGEVVRDLTRKEADLALRTAKPVAGDLIVTRLRTIRWTVAASPRYAAELGPLRRWTDARWVGFTDAAAGIAPARWFARYARGVDSVVTSGSLVVQASVVAQGLGVALLPEPSLEHFGLVPVRLGRSLRAAADALPVDELYLVTHRALRRVPRVAVTWDLLLQRLAEPRDLGTRA